MFSGIPSRRFQGPIQKIDENIGPLSSPDVLKYNKSLEEIW